jgi:mannitol-1-/sugar-/sorbitol-6-phosphatase
LKYYAKGLLFDNDGVLVDSHLAAEVAWNLWADKYAPNWSWDTAENAGVRAQDMVLERVGPALFEEANNYINQLEQETAGQTQAIAGAVALTTSLSAGTWTVCTSANPNLGRARLEAAGIPVPAELVTAYDVKLGKPNPKTALSSRTPGPV